MSFLDKIKKSDLEEFLKETSLYCVIDVKRIYDVTINLLKKFEGKKEITDESVREWKKLYDDWYYSLETNNPDYRVYSDAHYMSEVWLCWTKYSRRYLKDLLNKKSIKINNEYKTVIEFFGKNDVIIDLGCGFGYTTATLKEIWPNSVVYGTNIKDSVQFKFATELGKKYNFSIIEDFKNFGKKLVDKAKQIFFFPPNKLPVSSEKVFNVYKGETITGIEVRREPLTGAISKVADWVSGGKYTEKLKDLGYDKVFHLYMILKFGNRKVLIEKNERINITTKIAKNPDSDSIEVPLNGQKNLDDFLNIARDKMGDHAFFQYNARDNNCQDFLLGILKANDLLNPDIEKFIKQDAKEIFESLPSWSSALAQFVTDTGGKINQVINGGKKKIKKVKKKVERKGL